MRVFLAVPLLLAAGCGPKSENVNESARANVTRTAADSGAQQRVAPEDRATSAGAQDARQVVQHYFDSVQAHDYPAAYALWGEKGATTGGTERAFAATFGAYEKYQPKVGAPTDIKRADGQQYISVAVELPVTLRKGHVERKLLGPVMLRRSADPHEADPEKKGWRIWGMDVRQRH